ncbi:MAG TPA: hypothetical protein VNT60_05630 [Deinococcales bacterium]|nr:hypothetical protein [Deinococcales bacterium]
MTLLERKLSDDERLAELIGLHFLSGAPFPEGVEGFSRVGHAGEPPVLLGLPWPLDPGERWLAHALGSRRMGLDRRGFFDRAGSAAVLVTDRGLRLMVGDGGLQVSRTRLAGAERAPESRLEVVTVPYGALEEVGPGDLLFLRARGLPPLVLRLPFPRSLAALITGMWGQSTRRALPSGDRGIGPGSSPLILDAPD